MATIYEESISPYILRKILSGSETRAIQKFLHGVSGSNFLEQLIVTCPFNIQSWYHVTRSKTKARVLMRQIL